jgi:hypothetical protein
MSNFMILCLSTHTFAPTGTFTSYIYAGQQTLTHAASRSWVPKCLSRRKFSSSAHHGLVESESVLTSGAVELEFQSQCLLWRKQPCQTSVKKLRRSNLSDQIAPRAACPCGSLRSNIWLGEPQRSDFVLNAKPVQPKQSYRHWHRDRGPE